MNARSVALVSAREVNFSAFSLAAGMTSNAAFALYSIGAKRLLATRDPKTTYALLTVLSCATLTPVALFMEWSALGASRLAPTNAVTAFRGLKLVALLIATGLLQCAWARPLSSAPLPAVSCPPPGFLPTGPSASGLMWCHWCCPTGWMGSTRLMR